MDLVGKDRGGRTVVVQFRSGPVEPSDVCELDRHVRAVAGESKQRPRGVLVGEKLTRDAEELPHRHGYEFRKLGNEPK